MSIAMALVDFLPVIFFLAASILLQRDLYNKMSKGAFCLFAAGTITIFVAGSFKAIWKLLYTLNICNFVALNNTFFPMQATGFILAAAGILALLYHNQGKGVAYAVAAPVLYKSNIIFVVLIVLGVTVLNGSLIAISAKRKKPLALILFVISLIFVMGMGYLSSKDFQNPMMNWIAECVNIIGQGTFLMGTIVLHKSGLSEERSLSMDLCT